DRRSGGEGLRELNEPELRRRPQREVGSEAREVHAQDGRGAQELQDEVAVGHGGHAVRAGRGEPEVPREGLPADGERAAGTPRAAAPSGMTLIRPAPSRNRSRSRASMKT